MLQNATRSHFPLQCFSIEMLGECIVHIHVVIDEDSWQGPAYSFYIENVSQSQYYGQKFELH